MDPQILGARSLEGLAPPPRPVPLMIRLDELFGGAIAGVGWAFLGLGMAFVWAFAFNADFSGWRFRGALETETARVTGCHRTHFSEGGSKHSPGHRIYANDFFVHHGEATIVGTSYGYLCLQAGVDALADFPPGQPELARLRGMRRAPFAPTAAFVLIFPLIGALVVFASLRTGLRDIRLLERGVLARGTVGGKRPTNVRINNRMQWEVDVSFKDALGQPRVFRTKTCFPEKLEAAGAHDVFYDPDRPEEAISVDALPEPLFADYSGGLTSDGWRRALLASILPGLTIGGNLLAWLWTLSPR